MTTLESKLRALFDVPESDIPREFRIRHLGAFWPHWNLHKRKCDRTHKEIISIFRPDCPYPVWHKDEWSKNANPPKSDFDFNQSFFSQAEKLFKQCPIAHSTGANNENCEYTDDAWHCRDCYLAHSLFKTEDCRYVYRAYQEKTSLFNAFCYECERCIDCVNCHSCFESVASLQMKNSQKMEFCYDCRNCHDCLFCYNLRNRSYCIANQQYTQQEYLQIKKQWNFDTLEGYQKARTIFRTIMWEKAYFLAHYVEKSENVVGNYVEEMKNAESVFFANEMEDVCNIGRGTIAKTCLDCVSPYDTEKQYMCAAVQLKCYEVRFSFQITEARFVDYSAYSAQLENCFGCCGLLRGKNCILNTSHSTQEYSALKQKIINHMRSTGEWWQFFSWAFAPNPYDESWSSYYFPLSKEEQQTLGYFHQPNPEKHNTYYLNIDQLPKTPQEATENTTKQTYWDHISLKPFQILPQDVNLCRELGVCLPHSYYMRRIQENFKWMPYNGTLRTTKCAKSWQEIQTSWPAEYDGRILCEEEYLKIVW